MADYEPAHYDRPYPQDPQTRPDARRADVVEGVVAFIASVPAGLALALVLACFFGRHMAWVVSMAVLLSCYLTIYACVASRVAAYVNGGRGGRGDEA